MITFRRIYLDQWLERSKPLMHGKVLDIGGKRDNKRGNFRPPIENVSSWEYVNIDKNTNPDYLCNAHNIPIEDSFFDCVLMCEVLEHLQEPELALKEAFRLLKKGGSCLITMPFLYPIHADPNDYQRWTDEKIKNLLKDYGFSEIQIISMGGIVAVISDLLRYLYVNNKIKNFFIRKMIFLIIFFTHRFRYLDKLFINSWATVTTGWGVVAKK